MKRVVVIHGFEGEPEDAWRPWLRDELVKKGFSVDVPAMPMPYFPRVDEWVKKITVVVGTPNENVYLVGHSLGCIAILRYIETLNVEIGGAVLVAGFSDDLGDEKLSNFFEKPIEWDKIKGNCKNIIALHSDNDKNVPLKYADVFKEKLGAKVVIEKGKGHFMGSEGIFELPVLLDELLEISK